MLFKAFLRKEFNFIFFFILSPSHLILNIQWGLLIFLPYKKIICMYLSFFCCLFLFIFNICVNKYRTVPLFGIYILNLYTNVCIYLSICLYLHLNVHLCIYHHNYTVFLCLSIYAPEKMFMALNLFVFINLDLFETCIYSVFIK